MRFDRLRDIATVAVRGGIIGTAMAAMTEEIGCGPIRQNSGFARFRVWPCQPPPFAHPFVCSFAHPFARYQADHVSPSRRRA
jgi:hypothetical protein